MGRSEISSSLSFEFLGLMKEYLLRILGEGEENENLLIDYKMEV